MVDEDSGEVEKSERKKRGKRNEKLDDTNVGKQ